MSRFRVYVKENGYLDSAKIELPLAGAGVPECLVIQLKRFPSTVKVDVMLNYPEEAEVSTVCSI
jgi:hypothetical protein